MKKLMNLFLMTSVSLPLCIFSCISVSLFSLDVTEPREKDLTEFQIIKTKTIHEGVIYKCIELKELQIKAHILDIDPRKVTIRPVKAKNSCLGVDKASAMSARVHAIAAINGGFYVTKDPLKGRPFGIMKINNVWHSLPHKQRAAIMWNERENSPLIDRVTAISSATLDETTQIQINGLNTTRADDQVTLYTPIFNATTPVAPNGVEVTITGNHVEKVDKGPSNMQALSTDSYVLSAGPLSPYIKPLQKATDKSQASYNITLTPHLDPTHQSIWNSDKAQHIVGGTPVLIHKGESVDSFEVEQTLQTFITHRHPRTAIGKHMNGHWICVVVEGSYENDPSKGMTMKELQSFMKNLGCTDAMNLCGGKSSVMVINNEVVNQIAVQPQEPNEEKEISDIIAILPTS